MRNRREGRFLPAPLHVPLARPAGARPSARARHESKALTVAIAGALAVPMAAHAVDFTVSGHVNRALFITDRDDNPGTLVDESGTKSKVRDNATSGTRIRVKGDSEMMEGGTAGVLLEYAAGGTLALRYAEVWFSGGYGKVSIGQGDQGGEGSSYNGAAAVWGTGHGQDNAGVTKTALYTSAAEKAKGAVLGAKANYYTSLDGGGGRNERLRYDTPAIGPFSAAVSVGNGDQVSAGIKLGQDFGGTTFKAGVGTIMHANDPMTGADASTVSASAGVTLPSGISFSGAWGKGKDHLGALDPGTPAVPEGETQKRVLPGKVGKPIRFF